MDDWKDGANKRRDERNSKEPETHQKAKPAKKDTKKWCAGKVGREHTLEVKNYSEGKGWGPIFGNWWVQYCSTCGKDFESYRPFSGLTSKPPPKWLIDSGKFNK